MNKLKQLIREEVKKVLQEKRFLNELGESNPYPFQRIKVYDWMVGGDPDSDIKPDEDRVVNFEVKYRFETEGGTDYIIKFENLANGNKKLEKVVKVDFYMKGNRGTFSDPLPESGEFDVYRIVSTVIEAAKDLYEDYPKYIDGFSFVGAFKGSSEKSLSSKRSKVYKYLLNQRLPNSSVEEIKGPKGQKYFYVSI